MATKTVQILVVNVENASLAFTASAMQPWLTLDVTSGTVLAGENQAINVTANTSGLALGNYTGQVVIVAQGATITEQFTMAVVSGTSGGSGLTASSNSISFGNVVQV